MAIVAAPPMICWIESPRPADVADFLRRRAISCPLSRQLSGLAGCCRWSCIPCNCLSDLWLRACAIEVDLL